MTIAALSNGRAPRTALPLLIDTDLVQRHDKPGPRYTSYPTADRFIDAYDAGSHRTTLKQRNVAVEYGVQSA